MRNSLILFFLYLLFESCTHDPTFVMEVETDTMDTMMVDTSMIDMGCMSSDVSFSEFIFPTIETFCLSCHSGNFPSGNVSLDNYDFILEHVNNGSLLGSIKWESDFVDMPLNQSQLDDCIIEKFESWINDGAQNN